MRRFCFLPSLALLLLLAWAPAASAADSYQERVLADQPIAYWRFEGNKAELDANSTAAKQLTAAKSVGSVRFGENGPQSDRFPLFETTNLATRWTADGRLVVADPGDNSPLDFTLGDAITIEAWVNVKTLAKGQTPYILGKGRTRNEGVDPENQNYALRLVGIDSGAGVSFLFRNVANRRGKREDFHRWDSTAGFALDGGWHHVAVSYRFGEPDSVRGYVDGQRVEGKWSDAYGGSSKDGPVVDNDELWIGSSMAMSKSSSFEGWLDELALYRTALAPERIAEHFRRIDPQPYITRDIPPPGKVLYEVFEGIPDSNSWSFIMPEPRERFTSTEFAPFELPQKYNAKGIRDDRSSPLVVRASGELDLPAGKHRLLVRFRGATRLSIDGEVLYQPNFAKPPGDGHNPVYDLKSDVAPGIRPLQAGDREQVVEFTSPGKRHVITWELHAGGRKRRPEMGEASLSLALAGEETFRVIGARPFVLTDLDWEHYVVERRAELTQLNQVRRRDISREWAELWNERHRTARAEMADEKPIEPPQVANSAKLTPIDRFIAARLQRDKLTAAPQIDDAAFVRRAALDIIGTIPTRAMIAEFENDPAETRRARLIDRLLEHPGWADHWVGYWQDVLAENPNIINPTLNNTGPFRWWIYESFLDNKPFDRLASELILMDGSVNYGGAGGFAMASQNDAPMAAKAHILAQALLGVEMKCARCHDAPYHDLTQEQLFSFAAMLDRKPQKLPATSTIPGGQEGTKSELVKVTLKPGQVIAPRWPFAEFIEPGERGDASVGTLDLRDELARLITSPNNHRFAQVIVNRVWQRYLGRGIVEPVDDWENAEPSHPELLAWLEREFVSHDYDLKHLARLILNSRVYQRQSVPHEQLKQHPINLFASAPRRRLSAEQVVDSLFVASGKPMNVEEINIDVDGGRLVTASINLGTATRAWQFTSMSNERDRPSLSLPGVQTVVNVLEAFGWRGARPDPVTVRAQEPSVLQPAILAQGVVAKRTAQLSDDSVMTQLALDDLSVEAYVEAVFRQVLSRRPNAREQALFVELLREGYDARIASLDAPLNLPRPVGSLGVSWSNHLKPAANERKVAAAAKLELGDPVTARLRPEWRERAEDMIWSLVNSPEFVFVP